MDKFSSARQLPLHHITIRIKVTVNLIEFLGVRCWPIREQAGAD